MNGDGEYVVSFENFSSINIFTLFVYYLNLKWSRRKNFLIKNHNHRMAKKKRIEIACFGQHMPATTPSLTNLALFSNHIKCMDGYPSVFSVCVLICHPFYI